MTITSTPTNPIGQGVVEGPGYIEYGIGDLPELLNRLERLGEDFFLIGEIMLEESFPEIARHFRSFPNFTLTSKASANRLIRELRTTGINHIVLCYGEAKDEFVTLLFEALPGITFHRLNPTGKGITKRNISSSGEELPEGVNLSAKVFYERGGIPEIPREALYGEAAELAYKMGTPMAFAYPAVLTAACGAGIEASSTIRPTLYTSLLGSVGSGKSVTQARVVELFLPNKGFDEAKGSEIPDPRNLQATAASDQGLYRMLADAKGQPRFLNQDEGRNLLTKARIEGSSLAPVLCQLFSQNNGGGADKKSEYSINAKLSMLLCVKIDNPSEFSEVFGFASAHGLYDRSLFGVHPADDYKFTPWTRPEFSFKPSTPSVSPDVFVRVNDTWGERTDRRLRELVWRVAYVTCAINGDDHVTDESITAALAFMDWQKKLRIFYQTAKGANEHQDCVETILEAFRTSPGKSGLWREMAITGHWHRKFPRVLLSARKMLESQGILMKDTATKRHFLNEQVTKEAGQ